jgi:hypothetical protein
MHLLERAHEISIYVSNEKDTKFKISKLLGFILPSMGMHMLQPAKKEEEVVITPSI